MLHPGLYEQVINHALTGELCQRSPRKPLRAQLKLLKLRQKNQTTQIGNKYYSSCWSASSSAAFTLPVCTETVSSFFLRKLPPRSLNTVASSKMRSSAHRSVESSLKSSRKRARFLLLVKTMLSGHGELREAHGQQADEYHLADGPPNPGEVLEEDE